MPCGGPVHSLREPGTVWGGVWLGVESVPIIRVAAILVSDLKATPLSLFFVLTNLFICNP